jgi:acetylornithine/succinyldiaminopimelate/putrescine aminotransferase
MSYFEQLKEIRTAAGEPLTVGLTDDIVEEHLKRDKDFQGAVVRANEAFKKFSSFQRDLLKNDESVVIQKLQEGIINFYAHDCGSPFVPLAAKGAWIITAYGRVVYETGGYGMLGFGHNPDFLQDVLAKEQVMANVMTASFAQRTMVEVLRQKIGLRRTAGCPFTHFIFMNSGSEAMTVAGRISDSNAGKLTHKDSATGERKVRFLGLTGGFHGRTERPAQASDSSKSKYQKLASFRNAEFLWIVHPNNIEALTKAFEKAEKENVFIEAFLIEPVMGEGNPGMAVKPDFYREARRLTKEHGSVLIVDSIQAGLRTQGVLSIVDYPGFENLDAPDIESFSKAINAGQYPLSVLALGQRAASLYETNTYGNTMTANPRALEIGKMVLEQIDEKIEKHICAAGKIFFEKLTNLAKKLPHLVTRVQGTGLLLSLEFVDSIKVFGSESLEEFLRINGLNVIHGGRNSLRFTPIFLVSEIEIDLIISCVEKGIVSINKG